jgi:H+/Cl- antiporter ClcA
MRRWLFNLAAGLTFALCAVTATWLGRGLQRGDYDDGFPLPRWLAVVPFFAVLVVIMLLIILRLALESNQYRRGRNGK